MNLLFENAQSKLYYDPSLPALHHIWNGFVSGAALRESHEAFLQYLPQYGTGKMLSDARQMRVIRPADQEWIVHNFFPRALAAGYRCAAILSSDDMFNQTSVRNILTQVEDQAPFVSAYFREPAEARAWLQAQP